MKKNAKTFINGKSKRINPSILVATSRPVYLFISKIVSVNKDMHYVKMKRDNTVKRNGS